MNIKHKMVWSLVLAAEGVSATGAINGWPIMGVASVILGGMAMIMALLLKHQMEKIKLSPKLAMELR
ncbi:MAG: hypothetical protein JO297_11800 [Nitrososphaeraceae archaeon]|nr:hypothetical protein [Nitrososphaeraceae archaeon]